MTRIAVVRAGALGDVVLTFPALVALRARYPAARITGVGYPDIWTIARPLIDEIERIDRPLFAGLSGEEPSGDLLAWLQSFDLVLLWSARPPSPAIAWLPHVRHASPYPPPGVHASDWLLSSIDEPADHTQGVPGTLGPAYGGQSAEPATEGSVYGDADEHPAAWRRFWSGGERDANLVLLHPGAGAPYKRPPPELFAGVARSLLDTGRRVELIEGPADADAATAVQSALGIDLPVIRVDLPTLAGRLSAAGALVAGDTGVAHLAAMLGTQVAALFGPTDPASWAPRGPVRVLRHCTRTAERAGQVRVCDDPGCLTGISVEEALAAIRLDSSYRPSVTRSYSLCDPIQNQVTRSSSNKPRTR